MLFAASLTCAFAQDSPTPAETTPPTPAPSPSVEQTTPAASPTATVTAVAPPLPKNIRITFLPPPLEGTISLGIYDQANKLVRVLHQEAELDEFVIGEDALATKWDGRDNDGLAVPAGRYQARGFVVGKLKNEPVNATPAATPAWENQARVAVKLVANPLANDERQTIELSIGFDDENSYLRTADGLPLYTIAAKPNVQRALIAKAGDRAADVWEDDGSIVQQFRLSRLDQMMAFDCGDVEVK